MALEYNIEDIPLNHVKKFYLNSESLGSQAEYLLLLGWIRAMCCIEGTVFDGIPNANYVNGCPLIQIEIIHGQWHNIFLVSKMDLYLVAFTSNEELYALAESSIQINGARRFSSVKYDTEPWTRVGPHELREAMRMVNSQNAEELKEGFEIIVVHICEAARFTPLQHLIVGTFAPDENSDDIFDGLENNEELVNLVDDNILSNELDVHQLIRPAHPVNLSTSVNTHRYIKEFIDNWPKLSKIWYVYSLTDRNIFHVMHGDHTKFGIKNKRSLRSILGVLWNLNSRKLMNEWRKKIDNVPNFTNNLYNIMAQRAVNLQNNGQIRRVND